MPEEKLFFPEHHTADHLVDALLGGTKITDIFEEKLSAITTNITATIRTLGWKWFNCFGHNLNLYSNKLCRMSNREQREPW